MAIPDEHLREEGGSDGRRVMTEVTVTLCDPVLMSDCGVSRARWGWDADEHIREDGEHLVGDAEDGVACELTSERDQKPRNDL